MPKSRPPYSPEFRRQMVDQVRAGRDPGELAREFEPAGQSIRASVAKSSEKDGRHEAGGCRPRGAWTRRVGAFAPREQPTLAGARHSLKSCGLARPRDRNAAVRVFGFMSANQACFPVATIARVLGVSKAGFYAWLHRAPSAHAVADGALLQRVRTMHASSRQTCGAPHVHAELRAHGAAHVSGGGKVYHGSGGMTQTTARLSTWRFTSGGTPEACRGCWRSLTVECARSRRARPAAPAPVRPAPQPAMLGHGWHALRSSW